MTDTLSAAILAIYLILAIPVLYVAVKHGRNGLLAWLFLFLFCGIRIVGSGLALGGGSAASIVSNVGLSPILLATSGILHEARIYRIRKLDAKLEWVLQLFYHMAVVGGVAITAAGSAKLQAAEQQHEDQLPLEKAEKLVKVGMAILTLSWAALVGWTGLTFVAPRARDSPLESAGSLLLKTVAFSLVFIGVRVFYSLVALCTMEPYLSPTTGSLALRVLLGFLPELIAALAYVAVGFLTRGVAKGAKLLASASKARPQSVPYV